ncbi:MULTISPECIES: hypothetical protein [unclassified Streptomyces]|uniref:hypothetical protein n=1 Tax=unclassified Streptomyces TaxID=2593676 RepID=UPI002DD9A137|nr:hypothetical protein [Streptomyces sp. NBC_01294]WRZ58176.1 hypothetical protein OG534_17725 [Streptomyces sp. NBC_01294]
MRAPAAVLPASLLVLVLALATGCTKAASGTPGADDPPRSSAGPPSADVTRAYDTYWTTWLAANRTPDPQDPGLEQVAAGRQLRELRDNLAQSKESGQVLLGEVGHRVTGMETTGEHTRVVHDCVDLDRWLIHDSATGRPIDQLEDKPSQQGAFTMIREREGAPWKVGSVDVLGENC